MGTHTPSGIVRAVHPDLSPAPLPDHPEPGTAHPTAEVVATGPFKVYSPGLTDWEPGIDLQSDPTGLTVTTPSGPHAYAANRFTVETSPDGRILWILGDRTAPDPADPHPPVTVLMPATLDDLSSCMPAVEFADLTEAARIIHRLTAATAAGRHTRHRFGLQQEDDLGLIVDPVDGEPVIGLLRLTDRGMEFRTGGRWEADEPSARIPLFTSIIPVTRGAVARFDRLERSPEMSLSLFDRFAMFESRFMPTDAPTPSVRNAKSEMHLANSKV